MLQTNRKNCADRASASQLQKIGNSPADRKSKHGPMLPPDLAESDRSAAECRFAVERLIALGPTG
jgi:hypothetical protein